MDKKTLWLRLKTYEFDHLVPPSLWQRVVEAFGGADAATKAFADKLARKLGWSMPFALTAVAEYRKFVYLGMVSDFPVTPSKVIDQVWHEHQLFTQGYRNFCSEILGRHFDHHPELMPAAEQLATYQTQYLKTLALYRKEFNQDPPSRSGSYPSFRRHRSSPLRHGQGGSHRRATPPRTVTRRSTPTSNRMLAGLAAIADSMHSTEGTAAAAAALTGPTAAAATRAAAMAAPSRAEDPAVRRDATAGVAVVAAETKEVIS